MSKALKGILCAVILIILASTVSAQVGTAWVSRYDGPGNVGDQANALVVDDSGYVYVTGTSNGTGFVDGEDFATIKYKPNGDTVWVRRYNGPGNVTDNAYDLAVDDSGNVYVAGSDNFNAFYVTIKYRRNGTTAWVRRLAGSNMVAYALAVDSSRNVYVTGYGETGATDIDIVTIKYSPGGTALWTSIYNGPDSVWDYASAIAVDDGGNVYVTGIVDWPISPPYDAIDYVTIKYAPNGDTLWVRRYNGSGNDVDAARALALDDSGNVYVTGASVVSGATFDYATIKYKSNGDTAWVRNYNGPGNADDGARAVAVDSSGNVYVTGGSTGSGTNSDYATIKYAANGDTVWVRRHNGPDNFGDYAAALAVDKSGNVFVTGLENTNASSQDHATVKYMPNGDTAWVKRYNGPFNVYDAASAIAVDTSGNVYVTGTSQGTVSSTDYATIKYSACVAKPGDANASNDYSLGDAISIVNYIFNKPGCSPTPLCWLSSLLCRGDWDGSSTVSLSDVIRAVNFIFSKPGGPWNALPVGVCCL